MLGVTDYGTFVVTVLIFLLIPGPGNLALITSTSKGGIVGGLAATLGVILGDQILMWSAVAGVAALLNAYPDAFNAVQWVGAGYLAWLGAKMLLAKPGAAPVLNITAGHYLRQAMMITVLNPKAILFAVAFLPQFINPQKAQLSQFVILLATFAVIEVSWYFVYAISGNRLAAYLQRASVLRVFNRVTGGAFVGFAAMMAAVRD